MLFLGLKVVCEWILIFQFFCFQQKKNTYF
jgi:hypothetical protein